MSGGMKQYLWDRYRNRIVDVETSLCHCSSHSQRKRRKGVKFYPGCILIDVADLALWSTYWDFVFDSVAEKYPEVAMEAYLLCQ